MKLKYLYALLLAALMYSCDDSTTGIGDSIISEEDPISAGAKPYPVETGSILADSVYARTNTAYLGKYTDPQYGEFNADFIAQFTCTDNFEFPETVQEVTKLQLNLYYSTFFGDSLNSMILQVDTLDTIIPEGELNTFYTSVDPKKYYNSNVEPLTRKAYAAKGPSAVDTVYTYTDSYGYNYSTNYTWQNIKLPVSLGKYIYQKYTENKNNYKDPEKFIQNVLKGFYIHCTSGDGTILYIDDMELIISYDYLTESSTGEVDSLVSGSRVFAATKEVIQANHFRNSDRLKELVQSKECTYLKTPAGIFTEVTLPIEEIAENHESDTLNAASITFTRYNEEEDSPYEMGIPQYLLMVRKDQMYKFFENNSIYDGKTSFIAQYVSSGESANTYSFTNIAPLISYCMNEKKNGTVTDDWNKVVLIPVKVETDSNSSIISIKSNLDMESARLKIGTEDNPLTLQVLYTTF
ncbi:MAG: DUF4270 domain-containing protein [Bacteroidaceae bacterium]|nr:DUF4270 domain-containing protein [Bacteroidaceae bacterium]